VGGHAFLFCGSAARLYKLFTPNAVKTPKAFLLAAALAIPAAGADLYWDGADVSPNADGGSGTWNTTTANWDAALNGGASATWSNAAPDNAFFAGLAGTVTLGSNLTVGTLNVLTSGYSFTGSTLTASVLNVAAGRTVTFNGTVAGASNILSISGGYGSLLDFRASSSSLSTININSGIARYSVGSSAANGAAINVGLGGELQYNVTNPVPTAGNAPDITLNQGVFSVVGGSHAHVRALTLNGALVDLRAGGYNGESFQLNGNLTVGSGALVGTSWILQSTGSNSDRGVALLSARTFTVNAGSTLRVQAELENTDNNSGALVKAGAGTLVLLNTSSYGSGTTVNAGILQLGDLSAAGTGTGTATTSLLGSAGTVTVNAGGTLAASHLIGTSTYLGNVLAGAGELRVIGAGHLHLTGANTFSGTAQVQSSSQLFGGLTLDYTSTNTARLASTATINLAGGNLRVLGNASAATSQTVAALNVTGGGFVTLTPGAGPNVTLAATTLSQSSGGTLTLRSAGTLGTTANLNVGAATLGRWATTQTTSETDTAFLAKDASNNAVALAFTATASGGATLASQAADSVYLANSAQTVGADLTIDALASQSDVLINNASLTLAGGGLIMRNVGHWIQTSSGQTRGTLLTGLASGDLYVTSGLSESADFRINVALADNGATPMRLVKAGTGQLILGHGGANTYTGGTLVNSGRLQVASNGSALGTGTVEVRPGGQLWLNSVGIANNLVLAGLGSSDGGANSYGALRVTGSPTVSGGVAVDTHARVNVAAGATVGFTGILSGSGDLEIRALSGNLGNATFTNAGNTFAGRFIVRDDNAVLRVASDLALGPAPATLRTDAIILDGGRFQNGSTGAGASFTLHANRGITLPNAGTAGYLHVWGGQTLTVAGPISGPGTLFKTDGGTLVLTGLSPLTGGMQFNGGTVRIDAGGGFTNAGRLQFRGSSTLTMNGGNLNVTGLVTGDNSGVNTTVNLQSGTVTVTGTDSRQATDATFVLSHWSSSTAFNVSGGTLNVLGATMNLGWDGTGTFNQSGGEVNALGIRLDSGRNNAFTYNLTGGRLNLGGSGIGANAAKTFNLGAGTLSAYANWSTSQVINLTNAATGGTVDPAARTLTWTGGTAGSGLLVLNGEGTLNLNAAGTHSGGTTVAKGYLGIGNAAALLSTGTLTVQGGTVGIGAFNADLGDTVNLSGGEITGTTGILVSQVINVTGGTLSALADATVTINKTGAGAANLTREVGATVNVTGGTLNLSAAMTGALTLSANGTVVATAAPAGSVTLETGGTLDVRTALASAPTFSGGDLVMGNGSSLAAGLALSWSSGTVTLDTGSSLAASNLLAVGAGGILALSGSAMPASATISLAEGAILDLTAASSPSFSAGGQSIEAGRALGSGAADILGDLTLAGARLNVAGTGSAGILTFRDNLTVSGGTLQFDLADTAAGSNDTISVLGALTLSGSVSVDIRKSAGALGTDENYILLSYGEGSSIDVASFGILGAGGLVPTRQQFLIADDSLNRQVVLSVSGQAASLVWSGASGDWDYETASAWTGLDSDTKFYDQDNVRFDASVGAGLSAVNLTGELSPNSVSVDAAGVNYRFAGSGALVGVTGLSKTGAGSLTLANTGANAYSGETAVLEGSLVLGTANALSPSSAVSLAAGATLDLDGYSATALRLTGSGTVTSEAPAALTVGDALPFTFSGGLTGAASLAKVGDGRLTFLGAATGTGSVSVSQGILRVGEGSTSGSLGSRSVALAAGATLAFNRSDALEQSGDFTRSSASGVAVLAHEGAGNLTLSGSVSNLSVNVASTGGLILSGAVSGSALTASSTGALTLSGTATDSSLAISGNAHATVSGTFSGTGAITKAGSGTLTLSGQVAAASVLVSAGVLDVSGTLVAPVANNAALRFSGDMASREFAGAITGTGSVSKVDAGELILSGANTFSGGLSVSGGRLSVASASSLGSGSLGLSGGATLALTGALTTGRSLALGSGGGVIEVGAGLTVTHNSTLTGGQTLTKTGAGQLNFSGYSGSNAALAVNEGTARFTSGYFNANIGLSSISVASGAVLQVGAAHALGGYIAATPVISLAPGSRLTLGSEQYIRTLNLDTATIDGPSEIRTDNSFLATVTGGISTWSAGLNTVQSNAAFSVAGGAQLNLTGYVSNGQAVSKTGVGLLVLSGNNSYAGGTAVNGGVLAASSVADAGGAGSIGTGYLGIGPGGTFRYTGTGSQATSRALWINQAGDSSAIEVVEASAAVAFTSIAGEISRTLVKSGAGSLALADDLGAGATISAGTLSLGGSVSGAIANSGALVLTGAGATVSGIISGEGSLTKSGAGTVTLSAANTFTGGTTVAGGVLALAAGGQQGGLRGTVNVGSGATLRATVQDVMGWGATGQITSLNLNGGTFDLATTANQTLGNAVITLAGGFITGVAGSNLDFFQGSSALVSSASSVTSVISGATLSIRQAGGLTLTVADGAAEQDLRIESAILSNGSFASAPLVKAGLGLLRLTGANAYTGATTISAGTLEVAGSGSLGSGMYAGAIDNAGSLVFSTSANQTLSGALSGSGTLAKSGGGTLSLTGASTRTGATSVTGGVLVVSQPALGGGSYFVGPDGTLRLDVAAESPLTLGNTFAGSGLLALNNTGTGVLALSGLAGFTGSIGLVSGVFDGSGFGGGFLYQGGRLLDTGTFAGTVEIASGSSVSAADLPSTGTIVLAAGATLDFTGATGAVLNRTLIFSGGLIIGAESFTGTLEVASGATVSVGAASLGQGKLVVSPNSTVTFTETVANLVTFAGGVIANGANLRNLEVAAGGTLTLGDSIDGLSSDATVRLSGGTLDLSGDAVAASIDFRGGAVRNAANFAGTLTVNASDSPVTLVVNGAIGGTVVAGDNAVVSGNGTFGSLVLAEGSTLSPGNSPGVTTAENLAFAGGSTWTFQAFSTQPLVDQGRGYDTVAILPGGTLDLSGASSVNRITLQLITLSDWSDNVPGRAADGSGIDLEAAAVSPLLFDLATFDTAGGLILASGANVTSLFALDTSGFIWADGSVAASGQFGLFLRELGDGRTALTLRAIPEPSTYGLALGGLALALAAWRRRRAQPGVTAG